MRFWYAVIGLVSIITVTVMAWLVLSPTPRPTRAIAAPQHVAKKITAVVIPPKTSAVDHALTITAVGDIMLDRYVRETVRKNGPSFPFGKIQSELNGDIVLGNLEGPFTDQASVATNDHLIFTFDPALAPSLYDVGFTTLSLANNHALNFGQTGLTTTRQILTNAKLESFGDPGNKHGFGVTQEINGRRIAFIGYHGLVTGRDNILDDIREAKVNGLFVIVMSHWGVEYQLTPSAKQIADAHALVDAGADLIIGAHPHVVQPFEIYREKFIAYSLGNFLFDQYFSSDTLEGLLLRLTFDNNVVGIELIPLVTVNGQVTRLDGARRDTLLERLASSSTVSSKLQEQMRHGRLTIDYVQPTD